MNAEPLPLQILQRYAAEIEAEMRLCVGNDQLPFFQVMRYHLGWSDPEGRETGFSGGKKLRPTLCLLACEAVGGDYRRALPAAAALELLHNFSLIHDDIQDRSEERRHRPTVWRLWGEAQAINVGDGMHVLSRLGLWRLQESGVPAEMVLKIARIIEETSLRLCEGQFLDISFERRLDIGVETYLKMIQGKTAALIGASLEIGALLGSEDPQVAASYRAFGEKIGVAFQIRDDILGIWGEEKKTGKPTADDIRNKKKSLPIVFALEQASAADRQHLLAIFERAQLGRDEVAEVLEILNRAGARTFAQRLAKVHRDEAFAELTARTRDSKARQELCILASFLIEREY